MTHTTKWALLCGGDCYIPGTARDTTEFKITFPHLGGCVNDIQAIAKFLQDTHPPDTDDIRLDIKMLTASPGENDRPLELATTWPTKENIERELDRIAENCEQGDLLYFHYSGHGIRRDSIHRTSADEGGDDLIGTALVMTDVLIGKPYLTGYQLGVRLRRMVEEKSLRVTVVLDSCFSGSGLRIHQTVTPRTISRLYESSVLNCDREADEAADRANPDFDNRNPNNLRRCWLSDPHGCVVLTACGTSQTAGEGAIRVGESDLKYGIFTHWMLNMFRSTNSQLPSHTRVIEYIKDQVKAMRPAVGQIPTIFGDGSYEFFGSTRYVERVSCRVIRRENETIDLDVGSAQGVAVGAVYDIFPPDGTIMDGQSAICQATVSNAPRNSFSSTARLDSQDVDVNMGYRAVLRRWALPYSILVRFEPEDTERQLAFEHEFSQLSPTICRNHVASFLVMVDEANTYEIIQDGIRLPRLPRISTDDPTGIRKLAYILSHVARYQALMNLLYSTPTPHISPSHLDIQVSSDSLGPLAEEDGSFRLPEGDGMTLDLTYNGSLESIWVSAFCFTASWGISREYPAPEMSRNAHKFHCGRTTQLFETEFHIPPKSRTDDPPYITDKFVIFASSGEDAVSWDEICLPSLPSHGFSDELLLKIVSGEFRDPRRTTKRRRWNALDIAFLTSPRVVD